MNATVNALLSIDGKAFQLVIHAEKKLTPQDIIDLIADYLLIDPQGLFNDSTHS